MFSCNNQWKFQTFSILNFETNFLENENLIQKLEHRLLVEATKDQTALSEANVKTNRMATTKWIYHKEGSFANNYLIFLENLFQF